MVSRCNREIEQKRVGGRLDLGKRSWYEISGPSIQTINRQGVSAQIRHDNRGVTRIDRNTKREGTRRTRREGGNGGQDSRAVNGKLTDGAVKHVGDVEIFAGRIDGRSGRSVPDDRDTREGRTSHSSE